VAKDKEDRSNVIAPGQKRDELKPSPRPPPGSKPTPVPPPDKKKGR
jgi:hypothetical protein